MKTTINKSNVMNRAWNIFRGNNAWSGNFSMSLRRAWEVEKMNIAYNMKKAEEAAAKALRDAEARNRAAQSESLNWNNPSPEFAAGLIEYYAQGMCGRTYFGD